MFENYDYKTHPANVGIDYYFDGTMSKEVLMNYLARAVTYSAERGEELKSTDSQAMRFIINTGAKYISRASTAWWVDGREYATHKEQKKFLEMMHALDPEIIFEACIFENISLGVNEIEVPKEIFEKFGLPYEKRNFRFEDMIFEDGAMLNKERMCAVPNIARIETQMYFYFRGCLFIDEGYEAIHTGQVHMIGSRDKNWECFTNILNMIREYAKKNARRHLVLFNAHTHGVYGADGKLLYDFHEWPCRCAPPESATEAHKPTADNPQETILEVNKWETTYRSSIFTRSKGGETHLGWSCDSLPYIVELDNFRPPEGAILNTPNRENSAPWGRDEISWFANQTDDYRRKWLAYAYKRVKELDKVGAFAMTGRRTASLSEFRENNRYLAHDLSYCDCGFGDENTIREIWINDCKERSL